MITIIHHEFEEKDKSVLLWFEKNKWRLGIIEELIEIKFDKKHSQMFWETYFADDLKRHDNLICQIKITTLIPINNQNTFYIGEY